MIFRGSWITALAPFVVAYSQTYAPARSGSSSYSPWARWCGARDGTTTPWRARPRGGGVFGAMSLMPLFFAKLPVGVLGGVLLRRYCPGRGGRRGLPERRRRRRGYARREHASVRRAVDVGRRRAGHAGVARPDFDLPPVAQRLGGGRTLGAAAAGTGGEVRAAGGFGVRGRGGGGARRERRRARGAPTAASEGGSRNSGIPTKGTPDREGARMRRARTETEREPCVGGALRRGRSTSWSRASPRERSERRTTREKSKVV